MKNIIRHLYNNYFLRTIAIIHARIGDKGFMIVAGIIVGLVSGLAAVLLRELVGELHRLAASMQSMPWNILLFILPALGILIAFVFARMLFKEGYETSLTPLIHRLSTHRTNMSWKKTFSHIITSGFTVGMGGALGLEAPIVMTGSAIGANTGGMLRIDRKKRTLLIGCGAAAGIASIFDSPIAGVLFVAEVMMPEFSAAALVPVLLASAVSAVISRMLYTQQAFPLANAQWHVNALPFYILAGLICAIIGVYMIRVTYTGKRLWHGKLRNDWVRLAAGGIILSAMIFVFPVLFGEGYRYVRILFAGNLDSIAAQSPLARLLPGGAWLPLAFCGVAMLLKSVAATITAESGGDGGIFAPSIFSGAFTGFLFARLVNMTGVTILNESQFMALGMCGVFAAVMKAPMTAIFLIAEVTGGYMLLVPLMIVSAISFFASRYFEPYSIYTKALAEKNMLLNEDKDRAILSSISVARVIRTDSTPVHKNDTLRSLTGIITGTSGDFFPVIDEHDHLAGIISLDKVRKIMLNQDLYDLLLVYDLMDDPVGTVSPDDNLSTAVAYSEIYGFDCLAAVDSSGRYLGYVSRDDIFAEYRNRLREEAAF